MAQKKTNEYTAEELAAMEQKEKDAAAASTTPVTTDNVTPVTTTPEETDETDSKWSDAVRQAQAAYAPYKPVEDEYVMSEPKETDYVKDDDWFNTYFPTVSREDEQERQRKYEQVQRWSLFGNALAAIGNAVGATQGLKPVKIYEPKMPDLQTWKTQLNSDRAKRATAEEQQKTRYATARNQWQTGKTSYARALNQWQQQVNSAARTIYNADMAKEKQESQQKFTDEQRELKQKDALERIFAQVAGRIQVKQTAGAKAGGGSSSSGSRTSSGSYSIDKFTPSQVNTAFDNAVAQGIIKETYDNSQDVGTKRAALKKAYGKSSVSTKTTGSTGGNNGGKKTLPNAPYFHK